MTNTSVQAGQARWRLVLSNGSDGDQIFPITGETFTIGRELYNDLPLDDLHISKNHARLMQQGQQLIIEDLHSVNGTMVNNVPITEPYLLQAGDVITLGAFAFTVEQETSGLPQTRIQTRAHPVVRPEPRPRRGLALAGIIGFLLITIVILVVGGYWLYANLGPTAVELPPTATAPADLPTIVVNQGPVDDSEIDINRSVLIQATASDADGVTQMELWVNDRQIDSVVSQLTQEVPSMTAAFQWTPETAGTYTLDIRAYNQRGRVSTVTVATLTAVGPPSTPTLEVIDTPTPTITPLPPPATSTFTPTPSPIPTSQATAIPAALLTINVSALNVRAGPSTQYRVVGQLNRGSQAEIVGQADIGQGLWWQISFGATPDGLGWVSADPNFGTAANFDSVPPVTPSPLPAVAPTSTPLPTSTATPSAPVIRAPAGQTLLIVSNRSIINQPARLTLSGGKSVGGGKEIDVDANSRVTLVLEPDFYRALWSTPYRSFTRGADFTAVKGKVIVMWIVPEDGLTATEIYDEYSTGAAPTATPAPAAPSNAPVIGGYVAPAGKALLLVANRSLANVFGAINVSGGSFGGGQEFILNANTPEIPLELQPGHYRTIWSTAGFTAGHEFNASAGEVILGWIIPEDKLVYMQFPGQAPRLISN